MADSIYIPDENVIPEASMPDGFRVNFVWSEDMVRQIDARGDRSATIRYMIGFYLRLVSIGRMRLVEEEVFTDQELAVIADVAKPPPSRPFGDDLGALAQKAPDDLYEEHGVDREELFHKIVTKLDDAKYEALEDAILRYQRAVATGIKVDVRDILG